LSNVLDKKFFVDLSLRGDGDINETSDTSGQDETGTFNALIDIYIYPSY